MKKEELCGVLRTPYDRKRGYGITKIDVPEYKNIWFVILPPPPQVVPKKLPLRSLLQANNVLSRLSDFDAMSKIDKLVNFFFVRREAVQSSRMEGTWSTIDNVLTPGIIYDAEIGKTEHQSVRGYAQTLERHFLQAHKEKEKIFTESLICQLHKDIVSKDPHFMGKAGALRQVNQKGSIVQIGGSYRKEDSTFNPTPPKYVKAELQKFLKWLSDDGLAQRGDAGIAGFSLPVRIAIAHAHFEAIHPFSDGNGRVGRALWPLQMICSGRMPLYLSGFIEANRDEYSRSLQQAQKKLNYVSLTEFICEAIFQSDVEANITRKAIEGLPEKWRQRARFRAKSASYRAFEVLLNKPIITISILMKELKVSRQAATEASKQLVQRNVIRKREKRGREQVFAAEELISLLSRRFGTDVDLAMDAGYEVMVGDQIRE